MPELCHGDALALLDELGDRLAGLASIPTLVLCAAEDPIAPPAAARATADRIARARYLELSDAAHGVTLSHPARINAILDEHFRQADAGA